MKFSDLIHKVWKDERVRELRIRKGEVKLILEVALEKMIEALLNKQHIKLWNFGTLSVKKVKGRRIANPITKEHMFINDYYRIHIEPSKRLKNVLYYLRNK